MADGIGFETCEEHFMLHHDLHHVAHHFAYHVAPRKVTREPLTDKSLEAWDILTSWDILEHLGTAPSACADSNMWTAQGRARAQFQPWKAFDLTRNIQPHTASWCLQYLATNLCMSKWPYIHLSLKFSEDSVSASILHATRFAKPDWHNTFMPRCDFRSQGTGRCRARSLNCHRKAKCVMRI